MEKSSKSTTGRSTAWNVLPRLEKSSKFAAWESSVADRFLLQGCRGVHPRGSHPAGETSSSSSSFTPASRNFGDPLLLSAFATEAPGALRATEEFEAAVTDAPIMEGVDHVVLPQKFSEADHETSEEENELPNQKRAPYGSGWWGRGSPLMTSRKGCAVPLIDGGGLCSPGRWPIRQRILPMTPIVAQTRELLWTGFLRCVPFFDRGCPRRELMRVACGHRDSSLFPKEEILRTRQELRSLLTARGFEDGLPKPGDRPQAFEVRLIGELAKAAEDPDAYFTDFWARGVWVGSRDRRLPRTPAVFARKRKWRLGELDPVAQPEWQANYSSITTHSDQVRKQFEEEESRGFMSRTTLREALTAYGDTLSLAAIGAIEKKGESEEVRVIFDATRGVLTNYLI